MAKKKKKGYGRKFVGTCVVVGCIAALLWGAGNFGLGGGLLPWGQGEGFSIIGSGDGSAPAQNQPQNETSGAGNANDAPDETGDVEETAPVLLIRVARDRIYHGEDEIDIDGLMQILDELNQPGYVWELYDDQAIAGTYDNVKAIMLENGIEFIER